MAVLTRLGGRRDGLLRVDYGAAEAKQVADVHRMLKGHLIDQQKLRAAARKHVSCAECQLEGSPAQQAAQHSALEDISLSLYQTTGAPR